MENGKITIKKIRGLILFTLLIVVGLWDFDVVLDALKFMWSIIFPFALGGAIAFVINVPMSFLERKLFNGKKSSAARGLSLLLTLFLVVSVLGLVLFVVIPQLGNTLISLANNIASFIPVLQEWVTEFFHGNSEVTVWINQIQFEPNKMVQVAIDFLGVGASDVMNTTVMALGTFISGITAFFVAFSFACYVLIQKEKLHVQMRKVIFAFMPKRRGEVVTEICSLTYRTFSNFLTGQCVEAVILGSMFLVVLSIMKMPYALLIGIVVAISAMIPIFGAFVGLGLGFLMIFIVSPKQALLFVVVFLVLQQIEGNLVYPHVVGNSVGLPSIWVLAAVTLGGKLLGVVGMLIFIPIVSVVYTLFREVVYLSLKKNGIKNVTANSLEEYTEEEMQNMREIFYQEHPEKRGGQ